MRITSLATILAVTTSCSLIVTRPPPSPPREEALTCRDTYGPPIIDASLASAGIALGIALLTASTERDPRQFFEINHLKPGLGAAFMLAALPFLFSAPVGFSRVHACRDLRQSEERRADEAARAAAAATMKNRADAWVSTKAAAAAARAGDCDAVRKLDSQVRAGDAKFHATVFLADVGIRGCLAQPGRAH